MKLGAWVFAFLILMPFVLGATIHGRVFDYNFRLASNSLIKINTVPEQRMVAVDGSYSFIAPPGNYVLNATLKDSTGTFYDVIDNISITKDGDYVRDLILFPNDDLNELDLENNVTTDINGDDTVQSHKAILIITGLIIVIIFVLIYCAAFKKCKWKTKFFNKKPAAEPKAKEIDEEADDLAELLAFVRKNRRVTQKEIRKEFPLSEAKISLMITDLESQGKIRKIKKGRGNIIVYDEK
jgi:uncharacterized membrane protein